MYAFTSSDSSFVLFTTLRRSQKYISGKVSIKKMLFFFRLDDRYQYMISSSGTEIPLTDLRDKNNLWISIPSLIWPYVTQWVFFGLS